MIATSNPRVHRHFHPTAASWVLDEHTGMRSLHARGEVVVGDAVDRRFGEALLDPRGDLVALGLRPLTLWRARVVSRHPGPLGLEVVVDPAVGDVLLELRQRRRRVTAHETA